MHGQVYGVSGPLMKADILYLKDLAAGLSPSRHHGLHLPAHHLCGQFLFIGVSSITAEYHFAFADNGYPVRQGHGLVKLVGDEYNGLAVLFKLTQDFK